MQFMELEKKKIEVDGHRERIGQAQLKLENLLYKESYLQREIQNCRHVSTPAVKDVEDELNISITSDKYSPSLSSIHKLRLEMLRSELDRRRIKQAAVTDEKLVKSVLEERLHKKLKILEGIPEKLSAVAACSRELHDYFEGGCEISDMDTNLDRCQHLPIPLFVLFRSLSVLCKTGESKNENRSSSVSVQVVASLPGESIEQQELAVDLQLQLGDIRTSRDPSYRGCTGTAEVVLRFRHSPELNLIFVVVKSFSLVRHSLSVGLSDVEARSTTRDIAVPFHQDFWLQALFPPGMNTNETIDTGTSSPSSAGGILGVAYLWAQWLCGLRPVPPSRQDEGAGQDGARVFSLPTILSLVCQRF